MKRVLALTVLIALPVFTESNILSAANAAAEQTASDAFPTGNASNALFTNEWKFFKGDDDQSRGAWFDDTAWRTLDLPHDWSVEASFDPKLASCTAFLPGGVAWYRKHFVVPADVKNKCISIRFDGISKHSTVWCNGVQVGERPYGYSSFTCDLTPAIHFGGENVIAVRVNHAQYADSRWYAGSGIYRNVYLNVTGKLHIATYGTFVTTPKITDDFAEVNVQTAVKNEGTAAIDATIRPKSSTTRALGRESRTKRIGAGRRAEALRRGLAGSASQFMVAGSPPLVLGPHADQKPGETGRRNDHALWHP